MNARAVVWVVFLDIIYCFPTVRPVAKANMNYVSVVVTGLAAFVIGLWFTSKKERFTRPKIDITQLTQRRIAAINGEILAEGMGEDAESLETNTVMKI